MHLFGLTAWGNGHVVSYCTCGMIFEAKPLVTPAAIIRQAWQRHADAYEDLEAELT